jgi:hypothetical protein
MNFRDFPAKPLHNGIQYIATFPNGYGASIVHHDFSYGNKKGLWELAVLKDGSICYDTPITNDVLGYLTNEDVNELLIKIEQL